MRSAHSGLCGHKACLMHVGKLQLGAKRIYTPIRQAGSTTQTSGERTATAYTNLINAQHDDAPEETGHQPPVVVAARRQA